MALKTKNINWVKPSGMNAISIAISILVAALFLIDLTEAGKWKKSKSWKSSPSKGQHWPPPPHIHIPIESAPPQPVNLNICIKLVPPNEADPHSAAAAPPSPIYGPPSHHSAAPSSSYGAPTSNGNGADHSSYGPPPSGNNGNGHGQGYGGPPPPPSNSYGPPSHSYGAPDNGNNGYHGHGGHGGSDGNGDSHSIPDTIPQSYSSNGGYAK